jgi:2-isopropylmalate synthase
VDVVTLALNLYTQGVHPNLDFSHINTVAQVIEECTQLPIHPRHPYGGDLVFTAFSGSHQDAIKKGFAAQKPDALWRVPYLPIDPADLGRTYDSVIRVNSQSGKGGIAYLLERDYGVVMPRRMQIEFSSVVQRITDESESEITGTQLWALFEKTYLNSPDEASLKYLNHHLLDDANGQAINLDIASDGKTRVLHGKGTGPIDAAVNALNGAGYAIRIIHFEERAVGAGANAKAMAIVEVAADSATGTFFGVGHHSNIVTASLMAVISGARRCVR